MSVPNYVLAPMPRRAAGDMLRSMRQPALTSLFVVERRLPAISNEQLAVLQAALTGAANRFSARGDGVHYVRSVFLARPGRLLSFFQAESLDAVRAVNEAALVPFTSIELAIDLPGQAQT